MKIHIVEPEGAPHDEGTIRQLKNCAIAGDSPHVALCADAHLGYSAPIGSAIAYTNYLSPSAVGYDIGCGNKAVKTSLLYQDIREDLPRIMDEIYRRVPFGVGVPNQERVDAPVLDDIARFDEFRPVKRLAQRAASQLGSVGAGNHYVDLFREEGTNRVWIGVHFGSRGFGHTVASGFLAMAEGGEFKDKPKGGEMHSPPTLIHAESSLGFLYAECMRLAGNYAYAGRDAVCQKVLDILGAEEMESVHNHHNFAWLEDHGLNQYWVHRKGSTPLWPGQLGFVGSTMGENSVILEGIDSHQSEDTLRSAPHGAGRAMSRTEAAGKRRKRSKCAKCGAQQHPGTPAWRGRCPHCDASSAHVRRVMVEEQPGRVDWQGTLDALNMKNIQLRGGAADEAPAAYKRLGDVLKAHADSARVRNVLVPIGVAMAGPDIKDPYKD